MLGERLRCEEGCPNLILAGKGLPVGVKEFYVFAYYAYAGDQRGGSHVCGWRRLELSKLV